MEIPRRKSPLPHKIEKRGEEGERIPKERKGKREAFESKT